MASLVYLFSTSRHLLFFIQHASCAHSVDQTVEFHSRKHLDLENVEDISALLE